MIFRVFKKTKQVLIGLVSKVIGIIYTGFLGRSWIFRRDSGGLGKKKKNINYALYKKQEKFDVEKILMLWQKRIKEYKIISEMYFTKKKRKKILRKHFRKSKMYYFYKKKNKIKDFCWKDKEDFFYTTIFVYPLTERLYAGRFMFRKFLLFYKHLLLTPQYSLFFSNFFFIFARYLSFFFFFITKRGHEILYYKKLFYKFFIHFKKKLLYPSLLDMHGKIIISFSLGLLAKTIFKKKSFKKRKVSFILAAKVFKKIIFSSNLKKINIIISSYPLYLKEILLNFYSFRSNSVYINPLSGRQYSIYKTDPGFISWEVDTIKFLNTICYKKLKTRSRGRIKRKFSKKLINLNNILD